MRERSVLSADCEEVTSATGKSYKINVNEKLLELNIELLQLPNMLKKGEYQDLYFDNQILAHEKWDAKKTYKMNSGYFPGIATIGKMIVYLENRDGNANVKIDRAGLLERCYQIWLDIRFSLTSREWMPVLTPKKSLMLFPNIANFFTFAPIVPVI